MWVPWADTDSIGWIRYSLDQRKVPYTYLRDEDIRAGNLRSNIDVLLYGHVDLELAEQIRDCPRPGAPMPFKKTAQTPSFGTPAESDDITGGIGWEGLAQIQKFVEEGGLMVTLGSGTACSHLKAAWCGRASISGGVPRSRPEAAELRPRASMQSATRTPALTCASRSIARIIPSRTDIQHARTCFARISRSTTSRDAGCAWRTAPLAWMVRRIAAAL